MVSGEYPYAGLILPDAEGLDPAPYLAVAETVLAGLDCESGHAPRRSRKRAAVMADRFGLVILPEEDSDFGPRVAVCVIARNGGMPEGELVARILSDAVLEMLEVCDADMVEWFSPDVLLGRDDFIRLRSYVSPRRKAFDPIGEEVEEKLSAHLSQSMHESEMDLSHVVAAAAFETDDEPTEAIQAPAAEDDRVDNLRAMFAEAEPEEAPKPAKTKFSLKAMLGLAPKRAKEPDMRGYPRDLTEVIQQSADGDAEPANENLKLRFAGWGMAALLAMVSFPVAATLVIIGLVRGMDFRLATQALSVTALFIALQNANMLSGVVKSILN